MKTARAVFRWGLFALSAFYLTNAIGISRGTLARPGPGIFPLIVGILLTALALVIALRGTPSGEGGDNRFPRGGDARRVLGVIGSLAFYVVALPVLGHPVSSGVFFAATLMVMGVGSWKLGAVGGVLAAMLSWYLFAVLFQVPLPLAPILGR